MTVQLTLHAIVIEILDLFLSMNGDSELILCIAF